MTTLLKGLAIIAACIVVKSIADAMYAATSGAHVERIAWLLLRDLATFVQCVWILRVTGWRVEIGSKP